MTTTFYEYDESTLSCKAVSTSNITGTYANGPENNGIGATFTVTATGVLTIDGETFEIGDSVLLAGQTNAAHNGTYLVTNPGATGVQAVLTRRPDLQSGNNIKQGAYLSIQAGTQNAGAMYVLVAPTPFNIGVDEILFRATTAAAVSGTATAGAVATFADTSGRVESDTTNFRAQKANFAGGSATAVITDANVTAAHVVVLNIQASTNAVSVQKVTPGAGDITVLMSGDPGASTVFAYVSVVQQ